MTDRDRPRVIGEPQVGFFLMRLVKSGPWIACRIELITTPEEDDSPEAQMERTPYLQGWIGDKPVAPRKVWEHATRRINKAEYDYQMANAKWAAEHDPAAPAANPKEAIDVRKLPPIMPP